MGQISTTSPREAALEAEVARLRRLVARAGIDEAGGAEPPAPARRARHRRGGAPDGEERLRVAQGAGRIGTFDWDAASGEVLVSEEFSRLWGLPADLARTSLGDLARLVHPDDLAVARLSPAMLRGGALADAEHRIIRPDDGETRWIARRGRFEHDPDGRIVRGLGVVYDVTERRRGEARLAEAEERYRLAAQATDDAIRDWDLGTDRMVWSEAIHAVHGYGPDEVEPTGAWWEARLHPDDRGAVLAGLRGLGEGAAEAWRREYRFRRADGGYAVVLDRGRVLRDGRGRVRRLVAAMQDVTARREAEERQRLLAGELQHRVRNTLAMVQAIAAQTFRTASTPEARDAFSHRLAALGQAHDVLTATDWASAPVGDLVRGAILPHRAGPERFAIDGPAIEIAAGAALALTLALHELCTNAAKYGALSNEAGQVEIAWRVEEVAAGPTFRLRWAERGGPPVAAPSRKGFGSRLIERSLGQGLGGAVRTDYAPHGVVCTFEAPLAAIRHGAEPRP